jgi:tRNA-specific 2-thiouridylase
MTNTTTRVYVGLSGGVDSSVTAALLQQQGYDVVGVYMKNWSQDLPGFECPWREDYQDAKRVAVQLGIPFKLFDFETEYRQKVVDYMLAEYQAGRTPNPDIMCNQEVKFKLFLQAALDDGADMIATGHYAKVCHSELDSESGQKEIPKQVRNDKTDKTMTTRLCMATDANKDQTYFLYRVTNTALSKTIFPLGGYAKPEVRGLAEKFGLVTARKKESMGICFVGKVGIKDFLLHELGPQKPGNIVDNKGNTIGTHDGAIFYTIGQRHGLDVGGGLPYYVSGKDMAKNEVYVTTDLNDQNLWKRSCSLSDVHFIGAAPIDRTELKVRCRHRGELTDAVFDPNTNELVFDQEVRGLSPGQSAVFYADQTCLGGGIIS